ncbi:MAG: hypothetical protein C4589_09960 [Peptococcaceae bacterium]|nr:MAG: hypothetical protein C4589_09960 [Peptococcaceae bacterium]
MSAKTKLWLAGILLAAGGVITARILPRYFEKPEMQFLLFFGGILLAFGGLAVMAFGARKRS